MASIAKPPDGRYRARYQAPDGRWRAKHFDKRGDAQRFLDGVTTEIATDAYVAPERGRLTVGEWADKWIAGKVSLKPSTRATYESIIGTHVKPRWARIARANVTHEDVAEWVGALHVGGRSASRTGQVHTVVAAMLDAAVRARPPASNPARAVELPRLPQVQHDYLTHTEVGALADACGDSYALVLLLSCGGFRFREAAALRARNVDVLRVRVTIAESVTEIGGRLAFTAPKTHATRTITVPRVVADALTVQLADKGPDDFVFTSSHGGVLREGNWRRDVFDAAAVKIGRPGLRPHALRHTAASLAISAGAHVVAVSRLLGHASPNVTLGVYSHVLETGLDDVAQRLDDGFANIRGTGEGLNVVSLPRARESRTG